MDYFKDTWLVLDEYFKSNKNFLTKHHLESYNDFISNKIVNTIKILNPFIIIKNQENNNIQHEIEIYIGGLDSTQIFINKPTIFNNETREQRPLYPNEARLLDMTYKSDIYANIVIKYITRGTTGETIYETMLKNIKIGAIPIMLHSNLCVLNNQPLSLIKEIGECKYDQGGYFVIDGKEKVIVAQERIATNRIFMNKSKNDKYSYEGLIRCTSEENPLFPKTIHIYVLANKPIKKSDKQPNSIYISSPNISIDIPLFILFRALGVESDKEILEYIVYDINDPNNKNILDFLRFSIIQSNHITSQEDALDYIRNFVTYKHVDNVKKILIFDIFPNVGESFRSKALFLGFIINKLVKVCLGAIKESDRDSYTFKRVDTSGFLLSNLFRDYYNQFRNKVRNEIDREYLYGPWRTTTNIDHLINKSNINSIFDYTIIENGLKKSLKGSWGTNMIHEQQDLDLIKQGLSQDLSRISYLSTISHLRRVNTPLDPTAKIIGPHRLHTSQWGIMCPCESPDGASIGLLKNFAILCHVSFDIVPKEIKDVLQKHNLIYNNDVPIIDINKYTKILINNNWIGLHENPESILLLLKLYRRNGLINVLTSISWNVITNEINILTEAGRCTRPLYVIYNDKLLIEKYLANNKTISWNDMIGLNNKVDLNSSIKELEKNQAVIEFLDVEESNLSYIAMDISYIKKNTNYTHCEIHPSTILGVLTHNIPLANHNQAPRNIFSGAQGKQALGMYATNFNNRIDTMSYILYYPQKALICTRYQEYLNNNKMPHGENLIVAIATYTGYNMEDSIIFNKASLDRGCFNVTYYKNEIAREEENKIEGESIVFNNPYQVIESGKDLKDIKFANYKKLDENGFPILNSYISENDAYIGRTKIKTQYVEDKFNVNNIFGNKTKKEIYSDRSIIANKNLSGIVDKVFVYVNEDNKQNCKIRFRKIKIPELGDKLCSRNGQKGVIGMVMSPENMPFTKDGIIPDIIINPHAIPSRMTIAHLLESVLGKAACMMGTNIDATPFNNNVYDQVYDKLEKEFKMERYGNEILYNGFTGDQITTEIFIGPTYYERLKHMVVDKINYRTTGFKTIKNNQNEFKTLKTSPVVVTTRQPVAGRGTGNSGLRMGEMENAALVAHGLAETLQETFMDKSDAFDYVLDNDTEFINKLSIKDGKNLSNIRTPYAFKTFMQEVASASVKMHLLTEDQLEEEEDNYDDFEFENMSEEDEEDEEDN
jgi:DNA-directed RNA polymerase II subunit RPB2